MFKAGLALAIVIGLYLLILPELKNHPFDLAAVSLIFGGACVIIIVLARRMNA